MTLSSELEKLISLRDKGELSKDEFAKAKTLLLKDENRKEHSQKSEPENRKSYKLLVASCATLAAILSGTSAVLTQSPLSITVCVIWSLAAVLSWVSFSRKT